MKPKHIQNLLTTLSFRDPCRGRGKINNSNETQIEGIDNDDQAVGFDDERRFKIPCNKSVSSTMK